MMVIAAARRRGSNSGASALWATDEERDDRRGNEVNPQGRVERPEPAPNRDHAAACAPKHNREPNQIGPSHPAPLQPKHFDESERACLAAGKFGLTFHISAFI